MTMPSFLDASYALIAEEIVRANPFADVPTVKDLFTPKAAQEKAEPAKQAASNAQSMEILTAMMADVQNAPVRGSQPRRGPRKARR